MDFKRKETSLILLVLGILVFVGLNSYLFFVRCDMTSSRTFTLSQVSRDLYKDIPEQVNITYYMSERLRSVVPEIGQIEDLLYEFQDQSHGKITVETVDPIRQQRATEAESYHIDPHQLQSSGEEGVSASTVYSGIVIRYLDRHESIGTITDVSNMEYLIVSKIRKVVTNNPLRVGLLAGDTARTVDNFYQNFQRFITQGADVSVVHPGEDIPQNLSVLVVLNWTNLDTYDLYGVDQYIMRGGHVLFAGEGVKFDYLALANGQPPVKAGDLPIFRMLTRYGATVNQDMVLDQANQVFRYQASDAFGRPSTQNAVYQGSNIPIRYPFWVTIRRENIDDRNPVNSHFTGLELLWPSSVQSIQTDGVRSTVLFRTTDRAWSLTEPNTFQTTPDQAMMLQQYAANTTKQYDMAVALEGTFHSFFDGQPVPARPGAAHAATETVRQSPATRLILISDADFLSDAITVADPAYEQAGTSANFAYAQNCIDWLAGREDILSIRNREARDTTLDRIQDDGTKKVLTTLAQIVNVVVVPLVVVAFGVVRLLRRRNLSRLQAETSLPADGSDSGESDGTPGAGEASADRTADDSSSEEKK